MKCFIDNIPERHGGEVRGGEFSGQQERQGMFQALVVEDRGVHIAGQHVFGLGYFRDLFLKFGPYRVIVPGLYQSHDHGVLPCASK